MSEAWSTIEELQMFVEGCVIIRDQEEAKFYLVMILYVIYQNLNMLEIDF